MPRPPPPAAALIMTGYPISRACSTAASTVSTGPSLQAATGTPACCANTLA